MTTAPPAWNPCKDGHTWIYDGVYASVPPDHMLCACRRVRYGDRYDDVPPAPTPSRYVPAPVLSAVVAWLLVALVLVALVLVALVLAGGVTP